MFPERLKQLRKSRNLTLPQLAINLNKGTGRNGTKNSANQIGNWERGERKPDYVELIKLANYFDVSVDYLIGNVKEETVDILQLMFINDVKFDKQILTQNDKYNIIKSISAYFNQTNDSVDMMLDNQTELDFFGRSNSDEKNDK